MNRRWGTSRRLLPGRVAPGMWYCAPGGGLADRRLCVMRYTASGVAGTLPHGAPAWKRSPVYRPPLSEGAGGGTCCCVDIAGLFWLGRLYLFCKLLSSSCIVFTDIIFFSRSTTHTYTHTRMAADLRIPSEIPAEISEPREFSPVEILHIAYEARALSGTQAQRLEHMRAKHRAFWFRYPALLEMCCKPDMEMDQLTYMLDMLSSVQKEHTTMDEADRQVYGKLADKYGAPGAPHPPSSSS